ncbi:hypothetical protein [Natrialba sp. INN-245]|uniref:hypothetical protein n=1 Tax=Natrialba sp. INN-245 TaxID=2690967 RepID=UPI001310145D|nr:hypothetical protein [Natrialba sp. INN-245]MWV38373.1 hypothetical protein [Natrialba sp. INN-245]
MDTSRGSDANPFEETPLSPNHFGLLSAAVGLLGNGFTAFLLFRDPVWSVIIGLGTAIGLFLFVPAVMVGLLEERFGDLLSLEGSLFSDPHRLAAGIALATASVVTFAWRTTGDDLVVGLSTLFVATAVCYVVVAWLLPDVDV